MNKKWNYKGLLMNLLGVFVARATIGDLSPFAISYFASMYLESNGIFTVLCISMGLITVLRTEVVVKYFAIMLTVYIVGNLLKRKNKIITTAEVSIISGLVTTIIAFASSLFTVELKTALLLALAEGISVLAFTVVFRKGIEEVTSGDKANLLNNEEMISLSIIVSIVIYGLPQTNETSLAVQLFACLFSVLFVGYKYGAGYGTVLGVTCGITIGMLSGSYSQIGIFCMLGIFAGTFREFGRLTVTLVYLVATIVLFGLIEGFGPVIGLWNGGAIPTGVGLKNVISKNLIIEGILPLISGSALFLILPESIAFKIYNNEKKSEDFFSYQNIQTLTRDKLKEFSDSFHDLSNTFTKTSTKKVYLDSIDKENIFNELAETLCKDCKNCNLCWKEFSKDTSNGVYRIMEIIETYGTVELNQVPTTFRGRCIKLESFIVETRRIFDIEKTKISCNHKLLESREAIAEQFSQIGYVLDDFADSIYKSTPSKEEIGNEIVSSLKANYVFVDNIAVFEKRNHRNEIFIYAHTRGGHCVTTKEISQIISDKVGKKMIPSKKSKQVITKGSDMYIFEEDSKYHILTGVSKMTKEGSTVSGDNYSFIRPESGTAVLTLSDGMGTGETANKESEAVINLLEQFIEVGFNIESAIKLINSIMLIRSSGKQIYSTVDMSVVNLYTGMCDFIKLGASTTFIKSKNEVESMQSSNLPIGMINQMDYEVYSKKLRDGDFIIMVTDGVIECIPGEDKEKNISEFIATIKMNNPKEIANAVLNYSLEINNWNPKDDMTVLVGGFWANPT